MTKTSAPTSPGRDVRRQRTSRQFATGNVRTGFEAQKIYANHDDASSRPTLCTLCRRRGNVGDGRLGGTRVYGYVDHYFEYRSQ